MKFEIGDRVRQVRKEYLLPIKETVLEPRRIIEIGRKGGLHFGDIFDMWGTKTKIYYEANKFIPEYSVILTNKEQLEVIMKELSWVGYDIPDVNTWEGEKMFYIHFDAQNKPCYHLKEEVFAPKKNIIRFEEVYGDKYPELCKNKFNYYEV